VNVHLRLPWWARCISHLEIRKFVPCAHAHTTQRGQGTTGHDATRHDTARRVSYTIERVCWQKETGCTTHPYPTCPPQNRSRRRYPSCPSHPTPLVPKLVSVHDTRTTAHAHTHTRNRTRMTAHARTQRECQVVTSYLNRSHPPHDRVRVLERVCLLLGSSGGLLAAVLLQEGQRFAHESRHDGLVLHSALNKWVLYATTRTAHTAHTAHTTEKTRA
jgi:hypothetical protein